MMAGGIFALAAGVSVDAASALLFDVVASVPTFQLGGVPFAADHKVPVDAAMPVLPPAPFCSQGRLCVC